MTPDEMRRAAEILDSLTQQPGFGRCPDYAPLARLLREEADSQGWQPIETAPESCRGEYPKYVIFYNGHHRGIGFCYPSEDGDNTTLFVDETDAIITPKPTHWRPLPPPPQGREG